MGVECCQPAGHPHCCEGAVEKVEHSSHAGQIRSCSGEGCAKSMNSPHGVSGAAGVLYSYL